MIIRVRLTPSAAQSNVTGKVQGVYTIRLAAPPVEGKANEALIRFLAKQLDIAPSCITLLKGHTSKHKTLEIRLPAQTVEALLSAAFC